MNYRTALSLKKGDRVVLRFENLSRIPPSTDGGGQDNTLEVRRHLKKDILEDGFIDNQVYAVHKITRDSRRTYIIDVEMAGKGAYQFPYEMLGAYLFESAGKK